VGDYSDYIGGAFVEPVTKEQRKLIDDTFEMAIKALSQEPCEDAVSRQVVKEQMIKYGFHAPDMTVTEFVEDLPPVNSQYSLKKVRKRNE